MIEIPKETETEIKKIQQLLGNPHSSHRSSREAELCALAMMKKAIDGLIMKGEEGNGMSSLS